MSKNKKLQKNNHNIYLHNLFVILTYSIIGILIANIMLIIVSYVISKLPLINISLKVIFVFVEALCGFICSIFIQRKIKIRGIFVGLIASIMYTFFIFALIFLCVRSKISFSSAIIIPINILFCISGGILGANIKRRKS